MKALELSNLFKKDTISFERFLSSLLNNPSLKIAKIKLLKEKLIVDKTYKIVYLVFLENHSVPKLIIEIHDNKDYFQRNLFALEHLKSKEITSPQIYAFDEKKKIICREYLQGDFVFDLILKKKIPHKKILEFTEKASRFLVFLHKFRFKKKPLFLSKRLNSKIERLILKKTLQFIHPKVEYLRPIFERNLRNLFLKKDYLEKRNKKCLIHGDYQPANFVLSLDGKLRISDFDTLEIGNPARDLGRFLIQLAVCLHPENWQNEDISVFEKIFLDTYLKLQREKFCPDFYTSLNLYKAEMVQYILLGKIWGGTFFPPSKIESLLKYQSNLLSL